MAASDEERRAFGRRLRALREAADLTAANVAAVLTEQGQVTQTASVTAWERGEYAPQRRSTVELLEMVVRAGAGELLELLGYVPMLDKQEARFTEIERRLDGMEEALQKMLRRR